MIDDSRPLARGTSGAPARVLALVALALALSGALAGGRAAWLAGKGALAQRLLAQAWADRAAGGAVRPWPWADAVPVARLSAPSLERAAIVLGDASGEALAFGPGLVAGDLRRAADESVALGGHRDSHLAFLEHVAIGDPLELESADGRSHRYRVEALEVVDASRHTLAIARDAPGLVLITCYPFDARQTGGPLRFVATARWTGTSSDPARDAPGRSAVERPLAVAPPARARRSSPRPGTPDDR